MDYFKLTSGTNEIDRRFDRVIRKLLPALPLSRIYSAIRNGHITVNNKKTAGSYRLKPKDIISIPHHFMGGNVSKSPERNTRKYLISVLFENSHLLAINKPKGVLVHGENSILPSVHEYLNFTPSEIQVFAPGPLHRIDRNTSGIVFFGKTAPGARLFSGNLKEGKLDKYYLAVLEGSLRGEQTLVQTLTRSHSQRKTIPVQGPRGKPAKMNIVPILKQKDKTLVLIKLITGITHQIRSQCEALGYPLFGDKKYGGTPWKTGYFLHSYCIVFPPEKTIFPEKPVTAPLSRKEIETVSTILGTDNLQRFLLLADNYIARKTSH